MCKKDFESYQPIKTKPWNSNFVSIGFSNTIGDTLGQCFSTFTVTCVKKESHSSKETKEFKVMTFYEMEIFEGTV